MSSNSGRKRISRQVANTCAGKGNRLHRSGCASQLQSKIAQLGPAGFERNSASDGQIMTYDAVAKPSGTESGAVGDCGGAEVALPPELAALWPTFTPQQRQAILRALGLI